MANKKQVEEPVYTTKEERLKALKIASNELNKRYGQDVIHTANLEADITKQATGIKEIDELIGGGFPHGLFSIIWGGKGIGKTTIAYNLTAKAQQEGKIVYWIALEPFDAERAKGFGVNLDELLIGHFPIAEQSLDSIIEYSRKKLVDVIVLDSIHSLSPKQEQEEKNGDLKSTENDTMALLARKLSQFFRMAVDPVRRNSVCILMIGQSRTSLGFISLETLSGGNALHHNGRIVIHMRKGQGADAPVEKLKNEEGKTETIKIGFDTCLKIDKAQVTGCKPEGTELHLPFYYNSGFNAIIPQKQQEIPLNSTITKDTIESTDNKEEPKKQRGRPKKGE